MTPESLKAQPLLRQWLALGPDGRVQAFSGKVDLGQGISHALRLIVAEELRLRPEQIDMVPASTAFSPDEAVTSGSLSIQHSGTALRCAAAHWREACRQVMAERLGGLGVVLQDVRCEGGLFYVSCQHPDDAPESLPRASYAALSNPAMWEAAIEPWHIQAVHAVHDLNSAESAPLRPDVAAKVFGEFEYIHDRVMPGAAHPMCHGLVFRPGTLSAELIEHDIQELTLALHRTAGVLKVVRDGLLLGVLAETEYALSQIARKIEEDVALGKLWRCDAEVPDPLELASWLKTQALDTTVVADTASKSDTNANVDSGRSPASHLRVVAEFERPFLQHASIGLCCALAQWKEQSLEVWTHCQGIYNLRRDLALAFDQPAEQVQVTHVEGAGCYGHNGADDVAWDAAWLARQVPGRPVRVQWTRQAELGHAPLAPAMSVRIEAAVNKDGQLSHWTQTVWGQGHGTRPGRGQTPALLGAWQTACPAPVTLAVNAAMAAGGGSERNAQPPYNIPLVKVINHRVLSMPFRVSAMRALGAPVNVLAAESVMDELAQGLQQDPLAFRLAHLQGAEHARAAAVLQKAADMAGWSRPAHTDRPEGWGRGLAYARYKNTGAFCAVVVELVVAEKVKLHKIWIAADVGHVVDADGAINQLEGGALQATSWALCEAAQLSPQGIASNDWTRYPILKFSDMPEVSVNLMPDESHASLGAGECSAGPTCAAIANAIFDAIGVRVRSMPFTPDNLMRAIDNGAPPQASTFP
ncbi:molybdopterin cofactor-binding domain-containing protein [Limnohabitans sp. Rim8]|uniref:xanthine dehydrogenase family protein molybdopterin-binding subunit n=1 Tax=Limnohabitans sp. Rim8 TaxID=1100718 RepID=UPI002611B7D9|nr:molybdopterin cofactor-binding domain-containing protein [Limnohabitans sp. Rim8]